jgi:hypothetical protein
MSHLSTDFQELQTCTDFQELQTCRALWEGLKVGGGDQGSFSSSAAVGF